MITDLQIQHELLKTALEATDAYLGIEEHSQIHFASGALVTNQMLHDFTYHMARAHDALLSLGVLNQHQEYMNNHVKVMMKYHGHDDSTIADLPYTHVPKADFGEVEEAFKMPAETAQEKMYRQHQELRKKRGLPDPEHYKKIAQQKQKEIDAMKESSVISFSRYVNEAEENGTMSEEEIDNIVNSLSWEDIVDLYDDDELVDENGNEYKEDDEEEELEEGLTAQGRLKKRQAFARNRGKRLTSRNLKLRRASDPATLQKRARTAARNALYRRLLKGRDKSTLTASEKSRIEAQVGSMKSVMSSIQQKFVPRIRSIEQKRLAHYRGVKK
jgi:hypothetical protein